MGVSGLLQLLKPVQRPAHLQEFRGKKVAVDAMCWMHRGAVSCAVELALGEDTDGFLRYFLSMVVLLQGNGVTPVVVFDGASLPGKAAEEQHRRSRRQEAHEKVLELLDGGQRGRRDSEVVAQARMAIKITPEMIARLIAALKQFGVKLLVAPYEADAQLAFLCATGEVAAVITEDSDLLPFGCPKTLLKLDRFGGASLIDLSALATPKAALAPDKKRKPEKDIVKALETWTVPMLVDLCVLGGCDYTRQVEATTLLEPGPDATAGWHGLELDRSKDQSGSAGLEVSVVAPDTPAFTAGIRSGFRILEVDGVCARTPEDLNMLADRLDGAAAAPRRQVDGPVVIKYRAPARHIQGLGLKNAFVQLEKHRSLDAVLAQLNKEEAWRKKFPCEFGELLQQLRECRAAFLTHYVFDHASGELVSLGSAFDDERGDMEGFRGLCGNAKRYEDPTIVRRVMTGDLEPKTLSAWPDCSLSPSEQRIMERLMQEKRREVVAANVANATPSAAWQAAQEQGVKPMLTPASAPPASPNNSFCFAPKPVPKPVPKPAPEPAQPATEEKRVFEKTASKMLAFLGTRIDDGRRPDEAAAEAGAAAAAAPAPSDVVAAGTAAARAAKAGSAETEVLEAARRFCDAAAAAAGATAAMAVASAGQSIVSAAIAATQACATASGFAPAAAAQAAAAAATAVADDAVENEAQHVASPASERFPTPEAIPTFRETGLFRIRGTPKPVEAAKAAKPAKRFAFAAWEQTTPTPKRPAAGALARFGFGVQSAEKKPRKIEEPGKAPCAQTVVCPQENISHRKCAR